MKIGSCLLKLIIYESNSLKEKRQILRSVIDRIKARFNVSVAEVGELDKWKLAEIGISCVSNSGKHADEMINKIIYFIEQDMRLEIIECHVEIL